MTRAPRGSTRPFGGHWSKCEECGKCFARKGRGYVCPECRIKRDALPISKGVSQPMTLAERKAALHRIVKRKKLNRRGDPTQTFHPSPNRGWDKRLK